MVTKESAFVKGYAQWKTFRKMGFGAIQLKNGREPPAYGACFSAKLMIGASQRRVA